MTLRTQDHFYAQDYWDTFDSGNGYLDGVFWEDLACAIKETFGYSWPDKFDDLSMNMKVLDVGCAMGYLVRHLRRRGFVTTWGCDISQYAIGQAPESVAPYLRPYDLTGKYRPLMPDVDWYWDLLICLETLEHIEEEYVPRALMHLRDALAEGGRALLSICTEEVPDHDSDPTHVCIRPRDWWVEQMKAVGLVEVDRDRVVSLRNWRFFRNHQGLFVVARS